MDKITIEVTDLSKVSDGYHTIAELYEHRCLLWINLVLSGFAGKGQWVADHYEGWDFVLAGKESQISYHVPSKFRDLYKGKLLQLTKKYAEDRFDGHTSQDVLKRLEALALS